MVGKNKKPALGYADSRKTQTGVSVDDLNPTISKRLLADSRFYNTNFKEQKNVTIKNSE